MSVLLPLPCAFVLLCLVATPSAAAATKAASSATSSGTIPTRGASDPRVRYVDYRSDQVVVIASALGVVTRIILGDEKITRPLDTGFPSGCDVPENEWCVRGDVGQSQITVKPTRRSATSNNIEITTDKRNYSLIVHKMDGAEKAAAVYYRVEFRYPMPRLPFAHVQMPPAVPQSSLADAQLAQPSPPKPSKLHGTPVVRNVNYSVKSDEQSAAILPSVIFDDGRFTYLKFPKAREVPAVFAIDGSDQEVRIAFHSERLLGDPTLPGSDQKLESDYLVVRRIARAFRLRLGTAVADVINNGFDPDGIETINGTTTPTLLRQPKP